MKNPPKFERRAHVAHDHPASCRRPKLFTEVETRLRTPLVCDRYGLHSQLSSDSYSRSAKVKGFGRRPSAMVARASRPGARKHPRGKPRGGKHRLASAAMGILGS